MKFQSLSELRQNLQNKEVFKNEIKGKRLRKQLKSLQQMSNDEFTFKQFQVSDVAILLHIIVPIESKSIQLALRLDFEYPFTPPQLFYTGNQYKNLKYCKDLLKFILKDQQWGPSLTLPTFLQKLNQLSKSIVSKHQMPINYHNQFEYCEKQLIQYGVKLIDVQQYQWKYWVKSTKKKTIGLADDHLLVFDKISAHTYRLTFWSPVSVFTEVKANKGKNQFQLDLTYRDQQSAKQIKLYLGGQQKYLEQILQVLTPIQMIEHKIQKLQKSGIQDYQEAIKNYTMLIEYYSLSKPELMNKYMISMKKLIELQYSGDKKQQNGNKQMVEIEN